MMPEMMGSTHQESRRAILVFLSLFGSVAVVEGFVRKAGPTCCDRQLLFYVNFVMETSLVSKKQCVNFSNSKESPQRIKETK